MAPNDKILTEDVVNAYVSVLEKQVTQLTTILSMLENVGDKLERLEGKVEKDDLYEKACEKINKDFNEAKIAIINTNRELYKEAVTLQEAGTKNILMTHGNIMDNKINIMDNKLIEIKSSLKIDRAINVVGWIGLIVTIIIKLFIK